MSADFFRRVILAVLSIGCAAQAFELDDRGIDIEQIECGGEIQIINGQVFVAQQKTEEKQKPPQPDPAGDQVLELTDGSQLHGKLLAFSKGELLWQRLDTNEPLTFAPEEVRRILLTTAAVAPATTPGNGTLKLTSSDWIAGNVERFAKGRFYLSILEDTHIEVPKEKVEWLALSSDGGPDAYEGPIGPMGMTGWDTADGMQSWDYADGALVARAATAITRTFERLPEQVDIQFTAGDGGSNNRGLTMWLQPGRHLRGYTNGSCYLRFQAGSVSANIRSVNGEMKNFNATFEEPRDEKKVTRYRLLFDRTAGRLIVLLNGKQVADWDLPETKKPMPGGTLSWQPSYWSSNMAWTLSNIRIQPWDGSLISDAAEDESSRDLLKAKDTGRKVGILQEIDSDLVRFDDTDISRKQDLFIRLAKTPPQSDEPPTAIARIWLSTRGEFDATAIGFRDGKLRVRTAFAGDLTLPAAAIRAIEFPHKAPLADKIADTNDTLIFKNGDQLRGKLHTAAHDAPLRWQPTRGTQPVEFPHDRIAGILLATRKDAPPMRGNAVVRLHNGDWLPGRLLALDPQHLRLGSGILGELTITRNALRALYFGGEKEAPVWDGASGREEWMRSVTVPGYWGGNSRNRKEEKKTSPWRYLDGAYTLLTHGARGYGNGPSLGRTFEELPEKVDFSFTITSTGTSTTSYILNFFFDENRPGIMVQGAWDSAYIYDMAPRARGGVVFQHPQQIDFGEKVGITGNTRHFRFLGDRATGRLSMYVNGQWVGQLGRRTGPAQESSKPGRSISIAPQAMTSRVTISNLWVGPWSGTLPEKPRPSAVPAASKPVAPQTAQVLRSPLNTARQALIAKATAAAATRRENERVALVALGIPLADTLALANGDETQGRVLTADATQLRIQCDVGELEVPLARIRLIEFTGKPPQPTPGIRLRFVGKGALTVQTLQLRGDRIICTSSALGSLTIPLNALEEIIFTSDPAQPFQSIPAPQNELTAPFPKQRIPVR